MSLVSGCFIQAADLHLHLGSCRLNEFMVLQFKLIYYPAVGTVGLSCIMQVVETLQMQVVTAQKIGYWSERVACASGAN